jgi:hypothetical protein
VDGKSILSKWKVEVRDKANKKGMPEGYLLAESVSEHIFTAVKKPVQTDYKKDGANDKKSYMKEAQAWNACEALASDVIQDHLDSYLSGIFSTARESMTVHDAYEKMMKELSLDDDTVRESLYTKMDSLKQKNNESMVDYISRINTLKDQLFGVEKDVAEQAAIMTKLGKKAYSGMNEKSDAKY